MLGFETAESKFKMFRVAMTGSWVRTSIANSEDRQSRFEAWLNTTTGTAYVVQFFVYNDEYLLFTLNG